MNASEDRGEVEQDHILRRKRWACCMGEAAPNDNVVSTSNCRDYT